MFTTTKGSHTLFLYQTKDKMKSYKEIKGDLFTSDTHMAHCVSADLKMGAGIAKIFKNKYGNVDKLRQQKATVGGVAVLKCEGIYIFYLITKEKYWHKPTYNTLKSSLISMKNYCHDHSITEVSMPKIGCGLDRLSWEKVKSIIRSTLVGIKVNVYIL